MKRLLLVILIGLVIGATLGGCFESILKAFQAKHPDQRMRRHDEDKDGNIDTIIMLDDKGKIIPDPNTGLPKEVAGAREAYDADKKERKARLAAAEATDEAVGQELDVWGKLIGGGIGAAIAGVGGLLRRRKLFRNLEQARQNFSNVVRAWEDFRETKSPAEWKAVSGAVGKMSEAAREAVKAARAEYAATKVKDS